MSKIKVLVVDDSAMVRELVTKILSTDRDIEVVGTAADPLIARDKIKALNPDVLTLDVEMPKMDGLTFLGNLMRLRPMPVVMLSTLTAKGSEHTLEALRTGAVDFVCKPSQQGQTLEYCASELIEKVKGAATANIKNITTTATTTRKSAGTPLLRSFSSQSLSGQVRLIAIGASTGGTEAIRVLLEQLPDFTPPIVIAQHIPKEFSGPFSARMNSISKLTVKEAEDGEPIRAGFVYMAPGSHHLTVEKVGSHRHRCCLDLNEPVNRHRPSVDVLFDSVAANVGARALGILLTGMGKDGASGMARLRGTGAGTIAQDENTSVVWGMPGAAVKIGAVEHVVALNKVAYKLLDLASNKPTSESVLGVGT